MRTDASRPPCISNEPLRSTPRAAHGTLLVLLAALLAIPTVLVAQNTPQSSQAAKPSSLSVTVTPKSQKVRKTKGARDSVIHFGRDSLTLTVPPDTVVEVLADSSNSALYKCSTSVTSAPLSVPDSLTAWLAAMHQYIPLLLSAAVKLQPAVRGIPPSNPRKEEPDSLASALRKLDDFTHGPNGMAGRQQWLLAALDSLSRLNGHGISAYAQQLRSYRDSGAARPLPFTSDTVLYYEQCDTCDWERFPAADLQLTAQVIGDLRKREGTLMQDSTHLQAMQRDLRKLLRRKPKGRTKAIKRDSATLDTLDQATAHDAALVVAAKKALQDADTRLDAAYALERLSHRVLTASDSFSCGRWIRTSSDSVKTVTVVIAPDNSPDIRRLNVRWDSVAVQFKLEPANRPKIAVGVALLIVPGDVVDIPGTTPYGSADSVKAAVVGQQDYRFTYGLTLGLGVLGSGKRELWVPEITVTPSDQKTIGIGAGGSWDIVKLSTGLLVSVYDDFNRQKTPPGALLASKDGLMTKSSLRGRWYLALSVLALPGILR